MNDNVIPMFFDSELLAYMTRTIRLTTLIFVEVNTSICLMIVIPWQLIVKQPSRFKLKPYVQLDLRQQKTSKTK